MSLVNGWPSIIVLSIHVGLQLAKHILMLGHCLGRLTVMYINLSMGLNASCFFGAPKKHLPVYHSPVSFSHSFGTGIARDSDGSLYPTQVPAYIAYRASPQNIH